MYKNIELDNLKFRYFIYNNKIELYFDNKTEIDIIKKLSYILFKKIKKTEKIKNKFKLESILIGYKNLGSCYIRQY